MKTVIDATDCIAGRMATNVAKRLMKGEHIAIVNAEKAVITGSIESILTRMKSRLSMAPKGNPHKGPKYSRMPDRILKRVVRGMLPWKKQSGRYAYKNLRVYIGVPQELAAIKMEKIDNAKNKLAKGFVFIEEISKKLGATW